MMKDNISNIVMNIQTLFDRAGLSLPSSVEPQLEITGIADNSRSVAQGNIFVAIRGTNTDSHQYIGDAVARGAALIIAETAPSDTTVPVMLFDDTRSILGKIAHAWYDNPTRGMIVVGVTGTNGKTTSVHLLESVLKAAGYNTGVIGTIEYRFANEHIKADNTTPGAIALAKLFGQMKEAGVNAVAMEVSSHAIDQKRIDGIAFDACLFTNLTQDHLDYHGTMKTYADAKYQLFSRLLPQAQKIGKITSAVFNIDDETGCDFFKKYPGEKSSFAIDNPLAKLRPSAIEANANGMRFDITSLPIHIETFLVGRFNIYNILGVIEVALRLGISPEVIAQGIHNQKTVHGRFEPVLTNLPFTVLVDYSHTPDALQRALENARVLTQGKLIVVFGCGGDRDKTKRPIMGHIAAALADSVIITNDNPRTEPPESIAEAIREGVQQVRPDMEDACTVIDRRAAIAKAIELAHVGDIVLIAGKGHEDYQIIGTVIHPFDDRLVAAEYLKAREEAEASH